MLSVLALLSVYWGLHTAAYELPAAVSLSLDAVQAETSAIVSHELSVIDSSLSTHAARHIAAVG